MKKIFCSISMVCLFYIMQSSEFIQVQKEVDSDQEKKIEESFLKLRSPDFKERHQAVNYFIKFEIEELDRTVINEAILLLKEEIERFKNFYELARKPGRVEDKIPKALLYINSETFGDFFDNLCTIVAKSRDESVLPLLIDYSLNSRIFVYYGESAIDPLINALKTADLPNKDFRALLGLRFMLEDKKEGYVASGEARAKIKKALIDCALYDKYFDLRGSAVESLGRSGDKDLIPILEEIARTDPYHFETKAVAGIDEGVPPGEKVTRYPVRITAQKALEKLREKKEKDK